MFILNRLWEKRIKAENILRRLKDIASRLNDPQDFRSYLDNIIKNNGELNKLNANNFFIGSPSNTP